MTESAAAMRTCVELIRGSKRPSHLRLETPTASSTAAPSRAGTDLGLRRASSRLERCGELHAALAGADSGSSLAPHWRKADSNPWSRYMADAFETILVAWLAFAFLPERPTRSQGGTDGSNPLSSTKESIAN